MSKALLRRFFRPRDAILARLDSLDARLQRMENRMAQLDTHIVALTTDVTAIVGTVDSAIALINGISDRVAAAVAEAIAAGATVEQLEAIDRLGISLRDKSEDLATAVAANTPPNGG